MDSTKKIAELFSKHGQEIELQWPFESYYYKAFVQLMRYKNKMYIDLPMGEMGRRDNGCYLYIGPPEYDFSQNWETVKIYFEGRKHRVKRAQMIYCGGKPFYVWAVLYRTVKDGEYEGRQ